MAMSRLEELVENIHSLEEELESEIERIYEEKRKSFQYTFHKRKVKFEKSVREFQRQHKKSFVAFFKDAKLKHILSAPVIYSVIIPLVLLDIFVTVYQHICFRIYNIPLVKRNKYIVIDRQHLAYLNVIEKFNCMYCGYGNGLISYVREIIARTEQYWCPIKHAKKIIDAHRLTENFVDYGNTKAYRKNLALIREDVTSVNNTTKNKA